MAHKANILAFAGSTHQTSYNKRLVKIAVEGATNAGAQVTLIDLRDYPLPLYDQDIEEQKGLPENAKKLKKLMREHQGFLISSPEYNSSIPGVLKNALDWASRKEEGESSLICFRGKTAAIMSASPSWMGGLRGLVHLRSILSNIGVTVLSDQATVSKAHEAFDDDGKMIDPNQQKAVEEIGKKLCDVVEKLNK